MKLDAKTLIAETIKFFQQNPRRWVRNKLSNKGDTYLANASTSRDSDCFCAVGYMAVRLKEEGLISSHVAAHRPYEAVASFLGVPAAAIHSRNDRSQNIQQLSDELGQLV